VTIRPDAKILVFGAGSIGCYLAGHLIRASFDVLLVGRARIRAQLETHGLHISHWQHGHFFVPFETINFATAIDQKFKPDIIFIAVKSGDSEAAAQQLREFVSPTTLVVSCQNGIANKSLLASHIDHTQIIRAMVPFNVAAKTDGHFHCGTEGQLSIEQHPRATDITAALSDANLPVKVHQNLDGLQWSKLIMNLNNALNALSGLPLKTQLHSHAFRHIIAATIQEALIVLKAANIATPRVGKIHPRLLPTILKLPNWAFTRVASAMLAIDEDARSSMYEDLCRQRTTEIDYLNGEIVKLGAQLGLDTPINSCIVNLIKTAETNAKGSPKMHPKDLFKALGLP